MSSDLQEAGSVRTDRVVPVLIVLLGCGGEGDGGGSAPPAVASAVTSSGPFVSSGTQTAATAVETYSWGCASGRARLSLDGCLSQGSVRVEILDAQAGAVHDNTFPGTFSGVWSVPARPGVPGMWTIRLTYSNASWSGTITVQEGTEADPVKMEASYQIATSFQFDVGWSSGSATVNHAGSLSQGSVRIRLWDGLGSLRFDGTQSGSSGFSVNQQTAWGTGGTWKVRIDFLGSAGSGSLAVSPP